MSVNEFVDHDARQSAALANQKIDAHEDRCAERWKEARDAVAVLASKIDAQASRIWWIVGGVLSAEFAIIMWFMGR
jgi:hypothetical protein